MTTVLTSNEPSKFSTQPTSQGPFPCEAEQHMQVAVRLMRRVRGAAKATSAGAFRPAPSQQPPALALTNPTMSTQEDNNQEIILL